MIYLLTATGLTAGGSNTVHIYTQKYTKQHNETEYREQKRTYITIRIHKIKDKNTQFTKLNRSIQNIHPYIQ